ncbi:MAG: SPOR domain-containing protein [Duncaniella sp.]|uniref:SPOR domain-containing protein n=1 Tax=Duncaniella sp. TaxID=2518496 RepID=UPI0023CE0F33|nr:SPOR domain-containing protein [Duncaniella sp.]MDE6089265.1 SPOR domain-containing protein [Duncaniella sp.]
MKAIVLPLMMLMAAPAVNADVEVVTIVDHITRGNSNVINQPDKMLLRLVPVEAAPEDDKEKEEVNRPVNGRMAGYRVQVFSDTNVRTAKNEARSKQRVISSRFPAYQTYVMYNSPYWRLRVGDFRTQRDANAAAEELRKAFPAYSKEIRVVRDRVNVQD